MARENPYDTSAGIRLSSLCDPEELLNKLAEQCVDDSERWFGDSGRVHDIVHHCLGLAGEVGEFIELVKKIDRGSLDPADSYVQEALGQELCDVFIYLLNIAGIQKIDLMREYIAKRAINEERFTQQRLEREEDQVT